MNETTATKPTFDPSCVDCQVGFLGGYVCLLPCRKHSGSNDEAQSGATTRSGTAERRMNLYPRTYE